MMKQKAITWNADLALDSLGFGPSRHDVLRIGRGGDFPLGDARHFIGILIIASVFGAVACGTALISGLSVWASLAVYSCAGGTLFGAVLLARDVLNRVPAARRRG